MRAGKIMLEEVKTCFQRIANRVAQGGHHIPTPVIQRRFKSGLKLFHSDYKKAVNSWMLYDNSSDQMILLANGENP